MRRDDDSFGSDAFCVARSNGQHDAVAERDDGAFHIIIIIASLWDSTAGLEQIGFEGSSDEIQINDLMTDSALFRVIPGEPQFLSVVFGAVVKAQSQNDPVFFLYQVKSRRGINTAAEENNAVHRRKCLLRAVHAGSQADAAARVELTFHDETFRLAGFLEIIKDAVGDVLIEIALTAERGQIEFE